MLRNGPRGIGVRHQVVGNHHHLICIFGICAGIPQRATGNAVLPIPAVSVGVAIGVTGGRTQEGHIDVQVARGDGSGPPTMGTKYHREIHQAPGNLLCQGATQARGLNVCDQSGADVPNQGAVDGSQRGSRQGQIPESHGRQLIQHHIQDVVAVAEVMVEADGHAVLQSGFPNGFFQRRHHFIPISTALLEGCGLLGVGAGEYPVVGDFVNMGNLFQINHVRFPPLHPLCCRPHRGPAAVERGPPQACQSSYPSNWQLRCLGHWPQQWRP